MEPPIPHGLSVLPDEAAYLLAFFEADPLLVDAAAIGIPAFNAQGSQADAVNAWLRKLADALNEGKGIPNAFEPNRSPWTPRRISAVLSNRHYLGQIK